MNTFVPEGADYHKGAMTLDMPRLRKQLVEVQQIHTALVTGEPAHSLHHPATQMWRGHETDLLGYGFHCYNAYLARGGNPHKSGIYCLQRLPPTGYPGVPDWIEPLSHLHKVKLYYKNREYYAQYIGFVGRDEARYPVTVAGKTVDWVTCAGRYWVLDSNGAQVYKTAWAAIQHVRAHHTAE